MPKPGDIRSAAIQHKIGSFKTKFCKNQDDNLDFLPFCDLLKGEFALIKASDQ